MARFLYYGELLLRLLPEEGYAVRLEALTEALDLEVAATDEAGRVIVWNGAMAALAGPREGALGRPLLEAVPLLAADPNLDWALLVADALRGGPARTFPRHPLGDRVLRATLAPMRGPAGRVLGAVLTLEDITPGARAEERRRHQLRSDAVEALGAGVAHEIRNPLNALSLNLQLLRERLADPTVAREALVRRTDAMIAELGRIDALVTSLLQVSRGSVPVTAPGRIDELVREVLERLEGTARAAGVTVSLRAGSARVLQIDRGRIDRAIHNIVRNGIEAAGEGGHVWVATRDDPHSTVIVVDDDGPGIRPGDRPHVFELFWTTKRGGTGLGLPLARRDVEAHGGEVEVLERPGGGARFVLHLPTDGPPSGRAEAAGA